MLRFLQTIKPDLVLLTRSNYPRATTRDLTPFVIEGRRSRPDRLNTTGKADRRPPGKGETDGKVRQAIRISAGVVLILALVLAGLVVETVRQGFLGYCWAWQCMAAGLVRVRLPVLLALIVALLFILAPVGLVVEAARHLGRFVVKGV